MLTLKCETGLLLINTWFTICHLRRTNKLQCFVKQFYMFKFLDTRTTPSAPSLPTSPDESPVLNKRKARRYVLHVIYQIC